MKFLLSCIRPLAAIAGGAGMVFLFPPYNAVGLVWLVFIPLLIALWSLGEKRRRRKAFGLGFLFGLAFFIGSLTWLRTVTDVGWIALSIYLSLFPALWAFFAVTLAHPWKDGAAPLAPWRESLRSLRIAFCLAAVWCGLEWLRGWLFTGFGWNGVGVAFHQTAVIAQAADLLGVTGLSFLPVFLQAVIVQAGRRMHHATRCGRLRVHFDFACAAGLIAVVFGYGSLRLMTAGKGESIRLKALLVQLNIPQEAARVLWTAEETHLGYEDETLAALDAIGEADAARLRQAIEAGDEGGIGLKTPDWIVWPESALTGRILQSDDAWAMAMENWRTLERIGERGDFTFIMGLNELEGEPLGDQLVMKEDSRQWNSLTIFPPGDDPLTFRKHHLVIFGEYIPLVEKLPFLARIYEWQAGAPYGGAFSVGESLDPLPLALGGGEIGVIPTVCFEDSVPRLVRKFVRGGPQIIVNVTNDGWFKESIGAEQHFANARFRAIELRRPLLRCANTGVSAAVNPLGLTAHPETGKPQELRDNKGSNFTRGHLLAEVDIPKNPPLTLYAVMGDWGVILLSLAGVGIGVVKRRDR